MQENQQFLQKQQKVVYDDIIFDVITSSTKRLQILKVKRRDY